MRFKFLTHSCQPRFDIKENLSVWLSRGESANIRRLMLFTGISVQRQYGHSQPKFVVVCVHFTVTIKSPSITSRICLSSYKVPAQLNPPSIPLGTVLIIFQTKDQIFFKNLNSSQCYDFHRNTQACIQSFLMRAWLLWTRIAFIIS